ncbi:MAG: hypothetical protein AAGE52_33690 [Myxococcota bacterium]
MHLHSFILLCMVAGCARLTPEIRSAGSEEPVDAFEERCAPTSHPRSSNDAGDACTPNLDDEAIAAERACATTENNEAYQSALRDVLDAERLEVLNRETLPIEGADESRGVVVGYVGGGHTPQPPGTSGVLARDAEGALVLLRFAPQVTTRRYAQCECSSCCGTPPVGPMPIVIPLEEGEEIAREVEVPYPYLFVATPLIGLGCPPMP